MKVDYASGEGSGEILWRLGRDGDFTLESDDPYPWFSHQHDAEYDAGRTSTISLFDNGNTRAALGFGASSRGQVLEIDEANRVARHALNVDLGVVSIALGSAQRLEDGSYHFDAGFQPAPGSAFGGVGYALEVGAAGGILSSMKMLVPVYRSFRLADLYGPEDAPSHAGTRVVAFRE